MLPDSRRSRRNCAFALFAGLLLGGAFAAAEDKPAAAALGPGNPVIERVEPSVGPPGTLLRISGRRLRGATRVLIGDTPLAIEMCTPNLVTARLPTGVQSGPLRLVTQAGQVAGPDFSVSGALPAPVIERFQPLRAASGALVTISGSGFSTGLAQNTVLFGDAQAIVSSASPSQLKVVVPETAQAGPIRVRVTGSGEARSQAAFEPLKALVVRDVQPPSAPRGAKIEVRGDGFDRGVRVFLGDSAQRVLEVAPNRIALALGPSAQSGRLRVENKLGLVVYAPAPFEVLVPPELRSFAPEAGPPGTRIELDGSGFGSQPSAVTVQLGQQVLPAALLSPNVLRIDVPPAAQSGKITLRVGAFPAQTSAREFFVTEPLLLENVRPQGGPAGAEVALEGRGFSPRASDDVVHFAGVAAQLLEASPTRLRVRVPAARSGPIQVQVGAQHVESKTAFIVTSPPRVSAISAERLQVSHEFTVTGSGFGQNPALVRVTLADRPLAVLDVRDDAIVVRAPAVPGSGRLTVHVALQGSTSFARPIRVVEAD